jgi:hypothetical protein
MERKSALKKARTSILGKLVKTKVISILGLMEYMIDEESLLTPTLWTGTHIIYLSMDYQFILYKVIVLKSFLHMHGHYNIATSLVYKSEIEMERIWSCLIQCKMTLNFTING